MKRQLIDKIPIDLPSELERFVSDAFVYDSACNSGANVYFVNKGNGYYLKSAPKGSLLREAQMTQYFNSKGLGAEVLFYDSKERDFLLTSRVKGEDCTFDKYLDNPNKLCDVLGQELRKLHELDYSDCPVLNKMEEYFALAESNFRTGNYDKSNFPDSFGYRSADEAYSTFIKGKDSLNDSVLLHGDYCLPNVMLDDWNFSGFIDLGGAGVGDRHVDLFWGVWTLEFNLKTNRYRSRFIDAYGKSLVDEEKLKTIAAIEVFG
ncbi:MAG: aminoglycoside 3'-phosphotransferase [Clostridia bacterium]|nr:aminoglycoside 3'-phosphotransferase [Clostridia bacterium]